MSSSATLIGLFATGLWQDLGSPSSLSAITISGYVLQPNTLGRLNNMIGTCYSGSGFMGTGTVFDVYPPITNRQLALVDGMFRVNWYSQLATAMMGLSQDGIGWESIREGDSSIKRPATTNLGKEYRELARQTQEQLNYLANSYAIDENLVRSVDYLNPGYPNVAYPYSNPGGGAYWVG